MPSNAVFTAAVVPLKVIIESAMPSPTEKLSPAVLARVSVPFVTSIVTSSLGSRSPVNVIAL